MKQCAHKDGFLDSCIGAVQERPHSIATGASLWGSPNNHAISPLACNRPSKSAWPDSYTIPSLHAAHLQGSTIHHPFIQSHRPPHRGAGASHREMTAKHLDQGHITHSPPPTTSFSFAYRLQTITLRALHNLTFAKPSKSTDSQAMRPFVRPQACS